MKKKYLAMLMGLTLALSPVSAFADEEETQAADWIIVDAAENAQELSGRIEVINTDGTIVLSVGWMTDDEEDETLATLQLSGMMYELAFTDEPTGYKLNEQKVITVEEAAEDEEGSTEKESSDSEEAETTLDETEAEDADDADAEAESESESETETETETELDAEEITTDDLQLGDIITFTVTENYTIDYFILVGTE